MILKELSDIKRYTLIDSLILIIKNTKEINNSNIEVYINGIEAILLDNKFIDENLKNKYLDVLPKAYLKKINRFSVEEDYQKITARQLRGYAYFVYKCLLFEYKEFNIENISKMFTIAISIFTPDEVKVFLNNELIRINKGEVF